MKLTGAWLAVFASLVVVSLIAIAVKPAPTPQASPYITTPQRQVNESRLGLDLHKRGVVLEPGADGAWDGAVVESPSVVQTAHGYVMLYAGYGDSTGARRGQIGMARSSDGIHWTKRPEPILGPTLHDGDPDAEGLSGPVLLRYRGGWILYYLGLTEAGYEQGTKSINVATAPKLTGPWTRHGAVMSPGGAPWRHQAVWAVSIVRAHGGWFAFVNAGDDNGVESIGYATASSPLGPWTFDDAHSPLITGSGSGWDAFMAAAPSVRRIGHTWVMAYMGFNWKHASDGLAVTSPADFPLGWVKDSSNPLLSPSEPYDAKFAHKPHMAVVGGRLFYYYIAVDEDDRRQIALAVGGRV